MTFASDPLRTIIGLSVFGAQKGHGSFITCSLTSTAATPEEHAYLWIYMCNWKMRISGEEIAHSESPDDVIASAAAALNGRRIEALVLQEVIAPDGTYHAATLHFSDRASLRVEQYDDSEPDEAIFSVRIGEDHWVSYDSDGRTREHKKT
jgi:hypothetical protein